MTTTRKVTDAQNALLVSLLTGPLAVAADMASDAAHLAACKLVVVYTASAGNDAMRLTPAGKRWAQVKVARQTFDAPLSHTVTPCPHCGNMDSKYREDNGERGAHLTYLCLAPVRPEDSSVPESYSHLVGTDNKVPCSHQWDAVKWSSFQGRRRY